MGKIRPFNSVSINTVKIIEPSHVVSENVSANNNINYAPKPASIMLLNLLKLKLPQHNKLENK
jgi:hypothetical protein